MDYKKIILYTYYADQLQGISKEIDKMTIKYTDLAE
jgi:hypothetical protein